jgi:hypothetical protein
MQEASMHEPASQGRAVAEPGEVGRRPFSDGSPMWRGLGLARYRVTLRALEPLVLPDYIGSTLRGAFGRAFRRLCCLGRDGEPCPAPGVCPYHLVFETAPPPDSTALRTHDEIPRPFVIAPPAAGAAAYPAGGEVVFDLTLIGHARQYLPHFVVTLREVDRIGRGRRRVAVRRLDAVDPLTGSSEVVYTDEERLVRPRERPVTLAECAALPVPKGPVRVTFATQTRLKHEGGYARRPDFRVFFRRLLGRLSALARFHGPGPLDVDFRGLIEAAGRVTLVRDETRWTRWTRYSGRQDRRMEWEGVVGDAVYEGDLAPFWPYLAFGQWTHVGSATTFGLGRYRIEAAEDGGERRGA